MLTEKSFKLVEVYNHVGIIISEVSDVYCVVREFDICVSCKRL